MPDSVRPKSKADNKPIGLKNRAEMLKNKRLFFSTVRDVRCSDVGDGRKPMVASSHGKPKAGLEKATDAGKSFMEYCKLVGPGRSLGPKSVPSKNTTRKLTQQPVAIKRSLPQKEHPETKVISKQALMPSPRDQLKQCAPLRDERPRAKAKRQLLSGNDISSMISQLLRYDPNKFRDDDGDSNMVANFNDIQKEEKRSAVIARREDEEQLRLIEEEKKMHLAKKRKLSRE